MSVAVGKIVYNHGAYPCSGVGLAWSAGDLEAALSGPVAEALFDDEGKSNIEDILADLADTEFAQERLKRILADPGDIEDWRVGETIAETYLTCHRCCYFPWPDGRDKRKSGSSLPGADLVGFGKDDNGDCLAFGEVKTSSEARYPPSVMQGRSGLKQQLEALRDQETIRSDLLKYLGHRAQTAVWLPRFCAAAQRYLENASDVQLYGVLIRDVCPHPDDLCTCVQELARDCPDGTHIELLALYLPKGCVNGIGEALIAKRTGT